MNPSDIHLGYYDDKGSPCLRLLLYGAKNPDDGIECNGLIDTGFSRFIQLPFDLACALGLPLDGINTFTLANGAKINMVMALVVAEFAGIKKTGIASISPSSEILIGMEFLRLFDLGMMVSKDFISLASEEAIRNSMPGANPSAPSTPSPPEKPDQKGS